MPHALPSTLHVVATPIGNLGDLSERARQVLAEVDVIFAEDTRTSGILLRHYGIPAQMKSLHQHNEARRSAQVVDELARGRSAALISDAGTPAICDPGARIVREVRRAGYRVVAIPGPSALTAALSVAGIEAPFIFLGFLPARASARRSALARWASAPGALVVFEAPHRVRETLADLRACFGGARQVLIARELTKRFESIEAMPLESALDWVAADPHRERGEIVLIVDVDPDASTKPEGVDERSLEVLRALVRELPVAQAVRLAEQATGAPRNRLYETALALTRGSDEPH